MPVALLLHVMVIKTQKKIKRAKNVHRIMYSPYGLCYLWCCYYALRAFAWFRDLRGLYDDVQE